MFDQAKVPPNLWTEATALNKLISDLQRKIELFQAGCNHAWERVMAYDSNYHSRLDRHGGENVIVEFHCPLCNTYKPIGGQPTTICRKCGGKMEFNRNEQCGMDRAHVFKCVDCGHEYDTI